MLQSTPAMATISPLRIGSVFLVALCLARAALAGGGAELPDIGDSAATVFSSQYDQHLGRAFLRHLYSQGIPLTEPDLEHYIQGMGDRIARHSDNPEQKFTLIVVFSDTINAFAGPGGVLGINTGVLLNSRNESELAGVIAHEIAHITQRHLARAFESSNKYQLPVAAAVLGALLLGIKNPDAGLAAAAAVQGLEVQRKLNFTRANEEEADRVGMQFLARSGFSPQGMPEFFKRLLQKNRYNQGRGPEFLLTHPLTIARIADSEARAKLYGATNSPNSLEYELMRTKVEVHSIRKAADAVKIYAERLATPEVQNAREESLRYGYATALARKGDLAAAARQVRILLEQHGNNVHYLILAANTALTAQDYPRALKLFDEAHALHPDNHALLFAWCRGLLSAGQPMRARELLRAWRQHNDYRRNVLFFDLLAQAEAQSGYSAEGTIAKAEYFYLLGNTELSIEQLKFAEEKLTLDNYLKQRVSARHLELKKEFELEKKLGIRR